MDYTTFYNITAQEESNYLLTFNLLREYVFNRKSIAFKKPIENVINQTIEDYYLFMLNKVQVKFI